MCVNVPALNIPVLLEKLRPECEETEPDHKSDTRCLAQRLMLFRTDAELSLECGYFRKAETH